MITGRIFGPLISLILFFGYHSLIVAQEDRPADNTAKLVSADSTILNSLWKNTRNAQDSTFLDFYTPDAIKIDSNDSIWNGPAEIFDHHKMLEEISYILTPYSIIANEARGISYEVNFYKSKDTPIIFQLVIYEQIGDQMLRAFEFEVTHPILGVQDTSLMSKQIEERREQWMGYCNAHQVADLVNDLYSENTKYFNHRPLVKGREALIKEYGYMNSEQYNLTLQPRHLSFANESTVFEIGQCKGSYNGKYILIWKKEEDGQWRIFIDSNV